MIVNRVVANIIITHRKCLSITFQQQTQQFTPNFFTLLVFNKENILIKNLEIGNTALIDKKLRNYEH